MITTLYLILGLRRAFDLPEWMWLIALLADLLLVLMAPKGEDLGKNA